jgi:hypothetical protein
MLDRDDLQNLRRCATRQIHFDQAVAGVAVDSFPGDLQAHLHIARYAEQSASNVQERGCFALRNLACNDANRLSIVAKPGIEAILSVMTEYSNVFTVQEEGCAALGNLAVNHDAICVAIASNHGIEAIVSTMTAHTNMSKVQEDGCYALEELASNNDPNRVSIVAKHDIEAIASAMTAHSTVLEV